MKDNCAWVRRIVAHEEGEGVPYNFMFSPPAERRAAGHYGEDLEERLGLPLRMGGPRSVKPLYADPEDFGETVTDEFGVTWLTSRIDRGSPIGRCLPEPTLSGYRFPDPTQARRFEDLGAWCREQEGHYRVVWVGDLWERATFMRGMEDLLLDVALHSGFVEALLGGITDCIQHTMEIVFEQFEFEAIGVSDDYGTQKAMIISPESWRKLVRPCLARVYGLAKKHGRGVFHHSCGNIVPIIGDMIDLGLDVLHPIQPEAMDILHLKREFGRDVTFCGGIPTQNLLVTGTPDDVRREVQRLKRDMGRGGGYILEPGITIQDDVPLENMVAMIDEARADRR